MKLQDFHSQVESQWIYKNRLKVTWGHSSAVWWKKSAEGMKHGMYAGGLQVGSSPAPCNSQNDSCETITS